MTNPTKIILPNGETSKASKGRMKHIKFKYGENSYLVELSHPVDFEECDSDIRTLMLSRETRSMQNLNNLLILSLAKDLKASGNKLTHFEALCDLLNISLVTEEGDTVLMKEELEKS